METFSSIVAMLASFTAMFHLFMFSKTDETNYGVWAALMFLVAILNTI